MEEVEGEVVEKEAKKEKVEEDMFKL